MSFKLTKQLATQLGEVALVPFAQIRRIIALAGIDTAQALADEAVSMPAGDGMVTPDGKPRTVSGIFFHLARQRLSPRSCRTCLATRIAEQAQASSLGTSSGPPQEVPHGDPSASQVRSVHAPDAHPG